MAKIPIIDTHCDLIIPYQDLKEKFGRATKKTQTSLALLKKTNVKIIFAGFSYDDLLKNSSQQLEDLHKMIGEYPKDFELITDFKKVPKILKSTKIGVILHIEGAGILNNKIDNLIGLYNNGLRSLGLTHNTKNCLGTGALIDNKKGLTKFGKKVIEKCNELGIIIDLSHLNEKGFYESLLVSKRPVIISHGNCFSVTPNPRNFKDDQLKQIAKIGSIVGIFFSGKFLNPQMDAKKATIDNAILHIDHMVKIMGIDHIAIGSDFGGITTGLPQGLENHPTLLVLFKKLRERGYTQKDIEKIAFKNALRAIRQSTI